jgi:hypothetical protein
MTSAACGLRTPVRPPDETAPIIPGVVEAVRDGTVVVVRWNRAEHSADGHKLDDLAAFVVERKRGDQEQGEDLWERIARVDVADQEKYRRRHDFSWRDTTAGDGPVSYRVLAVDDDGQEGPATAAASATETAPTP